MDATLFRAPVWVRVAEIVSEVDSVQDAASFLRAWPSSRRGPVHACALRGCEAALAGSIKVEDARKAFESFARITGILASRQFSVEPVAARQSLSSPVTIARH